MTLLERRIGKLEMAMAQAQSHLDSIKESHSVVLGAFLCEDSGRIKELASKLQARLFIEWQAKGKRKAGAK